MFLTTIACNYHLLQHLLVLLTHLRLAPHLPQPVPPLPLHLLVPLFAPYFSCSYSSITLAAGVIIISCQLSATLAALAAAAAAYTLCYASSFIFTLALALTSSSPLNHPAISIPVATV
ncbi:hypothetical protein AYI69_g4802, partial [Smittium culicis]